MGPDRKVHSTRYCPPKHTPYKTAHTIPEDPGNPICIPGVLVAGSEIAIPDYSSVLEGNVEEIDLEANICMIKSFHSYVALQEIPGECGCEQDSLSEGLAKENNNSAEHMQTYCEAPEEDFSLNPSFTLICGNTLDQQCQYITVKEEPDDVKVEPDDVKVEPDDVKVEPDDVKVEPDDVKVEPDDSSMSWPDFPLALSCSEEPFVQVPKVKVELDTDETRCYTHENLAQVSSQTLDMEIDIKPTSIETENKFRGCATLDTNWIKKESPIMTKSGFSLTTEKQNIGSAISTVAEHSMSEYMKPICNSVRESNSHGYFELQSMSSKALPVTPIMIEPRESAVSYLSAIQRQNHQENREMGPMTPVRDTTCMSSECEQIKDHSYSQKSSDKTKVAYLCSFCGMPFINYTQLRMHSWIHMGGKPYKCKICGKVFIQNCQLVNHIRSHLWETAFQCKICEKEFTVMSALNQHNKTHAREKPHKCDVCGQAFAQERTLTSHKLHTH